MRIRYVSLEEAHPPFQGGMFNQAIKVAMINAYRKAIRSGKPIPPVPDEYRNQILAVKTRHSFN